MIFDVVVLGALFLSCVVAFLRGFIRETLTILGVVGGAVAALYLGKPLSPMILQWMQGDEADSAKKLFEIVPYPVAADILAYGAVFVVVVIVLSVLSHILSGWAQAVGLGALDRSLGVLFGIVRAVVLLALFYLPVYVMVDEALRDQWFKDSRTRVYVELAAKTAYDLLPDSVAGEIPDGEDSGSEQTKNRLRQLDLLKMDNPEKPASPPEDQDKGGYDRQERQDMQKAISGEMDE